MTIPRFCSALLLAAGLPLMAGEFPADASGWPAATATSKPWTRWWWLGSAVDKPNLTRELEDFAKTGLGGVEICPIYGAVGAEDRSLDFLSPKWMEMLAHTTTEAKRLGLGVDMTTGTGWPFGGPQVTPDIASAGLEMIRHEATGGTQVSLKMPKGKIQCLRAFPESGPPVDLTQRDQGRQSRLAPACRKMEHHRPDLLLADPEGETRRTRRRGQRARSVFRRCHDALPRQVRRGVREIHRADAARAVPRLVRILRRRVDARLAGPFPGKPAATTCATSFPPSPALARPTPSHASAPTIARPSASCISPI